VTISGSRSFDTHPVRYEAWFSEHENAYLSELLAVRAVIPWQGLGLEIGVGTGRFASPVGIKVGMDPSKAMLTYAVERGIFGIQGVAEALPLKSAVFDYVLIVTTICFVNDVEVTLTEAGRVLKPGGVMVIGFIDSNSPIGRDYLAHKDESIFYREATFHSAAEVESLLSKAGFSEQLWVQTLFRPLDKIQAIEPLRMGSGDGSFVVVRASRR